MPSRRRSPDRQHPALRRRVSPRLRTIPNSDAADNGVVAVINDQIVSEYDLRQRLALVLSTSGLAADGREQEEDASAGARDLKTEKLELEEAQRKNITVSPPEVDKEIEGIIKDNNLTLDQLKGVLARSGVAMETLRAPDRRPARLAEGDRGRIRRPHQHPDQDVSDEMARVPKARTSRISSWPRSSCRVDNPGAGRQGAQGRAEHLIAQLQNGAPFPTVARQFSQSPTAAAGGDLGWVMRAS